MISLLLNRIINIWNALPDGAVLLVRLLLRNVWQVWTLQNILFYFNFVSFLGLALMVILKPFVSSKSLKVL